MQPWTAILVRYGEIGVKSDPVRRRLEQMLERGILDQVEARDAQCTLARERGRIILQTPDPDTVRDALTHTFGVVSASPADVVEPTMEAILAHTRKIAPEVIPPGSSFAIRARRAGSHPFTSMDVGREAGSAAYNAVPDLTVDLSDPDHELHIEVRQKAAFFFHEVWDGPGGFPVGSQGRVVITVRDERDLGRAWLMARRGARPILLNEADLPDTFFDPLRVWLPGLRVKEWEGDVDALLKRERSLALIPRDLDPLGGLPPEAMPAPVRELLGVTA